MFSHSANAEYIDDERRKAEGLETIEQQETRIKQEKEALESINAQAMFVGMSAALVKATPDKFSKSERNEVLGAAEIFLEEMSQAKKVCGVDTPLKSDVGQNTPCMNLLKNITLMMSIWRED